MAQEMTLAGAERAIAAGRQKAQEIGVQMNIAVLDEGSNLVAFIHMDDSYPGGVQLSIDKAYTARAWNISTKDIAPFCQPDQPFFGLHSNLGGRMVILPGGIPLTANGRVVGAVGASGGSVDQDHEVAEAAAAAFSQN